MTICTSTFEEMVLMLLQTFCQPTHIDLHLLL